MTAAIEVTGLTKRYDRRAVVDDISFTIEKGEVFTLLGPNGAGKTTTVEMLEGLRAPDAGSVRVLGLDPARDGVSLHTRVGVMLQDVGAPRALTAREVLSLIAGFHLEPRSVDRLLERVGLRDRAKSVVRNLSGGELRRLSLAMALIGRPDLVFLDEPTNGLDVAGRRQTWSTIEALAAEGTTVFLTTHLLAEAQSISSRVAILDRGRLVALDTPERLVAGDGAVRFRTEGTVDIEWLSRELGHGIVTEGERLRIDTTPSPALIASLSAKLAERGVLMAELIVGSGSLEDVFLALAKEDEQAEPLE